MKLTGLFLFGCVSLLSTTSFADGDKPADPAAPPAGGDAAAMPAGGAATSPSVTEGAAPAPEAAPAPQPSVTLKQGGVMIQTNVEVGLNNSAAAKPVSIAPDISYGVTPELTASLVTSTAAITGFRGAAGGGICVTGTDNGCGTALADIGLEGTYSLMKGPMALGANAGFLFLAPLEDGRVYDAKIGVKGKYTAGKVIVTFNPSVWIGLNSRDMGNKDQLWIPVGLGFKATPELTAGIGTGFKSNDISNLGDTWTIPIGVNATYALNKQMAVGGAFTFGKIAGAGVLSDAMKTGVDFRALHFWFNYSM